MYSKYNVFTKFCAAVLEELHLRKTTGRTNGRTDGLVRISHILLWWFANGVHSVHSTWGIAMNCQSSLVITFTPVMLKILNLQGECKNKFYHMTKPCPSVGISYMSGNWPVPANIDNTIPSTFYQFKSINMLEISSIHCWPNVLTSLKFYI